MKHKYAFIFVGASQEESYIETENLRGFSPQLTDGPEKNGLRPLPENNFILNHLCCVFLPGPVPGLFWTPPCALWALDVDGDLLMSRTPSGLYPGVYSSLRWSPDPAAQFVSGQYAGPHEGLIQSDRRAAFSCSGNSRLSGFGLDPLVHLMILDIGAAQLKAGFAQCLAEGGGTGLADLSGILLAVGDVASFGQSGPAGHGVGVGKTMKITELGQDDDAQGIGDSGYSFNDGQLISEPWFLSDDSQHLPFDVGFDTFDSEHDLLEVVDDQGGHGFEGVSVGGHPALHRGDFDVFWSSPVVLIQLPAVGLPVAEDDIRIMDIMAGYVASPKVWDCPADDQGYFETYGTSYEYYLGYILITIMSDGAAISNMIEVANTYPDLTPVFGDAEGFHPQPDDPDGRLWCYYDGHVDRWPEDESTIPPELRK